jgi:peptide subunit release factor 1 (eRF1)
LSLPVFPAGICNRSLKITVQEVAMFSESDLRELVQYTSPRPVLSLYLNTDPSQGNTETHKLRVRSMLKEIPLPQDLEAIQRFLDHEYNWSGRGVAIFSCAGQDFLRAYSLAVPVRNLVHIGDRPSVKIMADLMDNFGGYGVVLVDKQGARAFHFHLGTLVEQEGVMGEEVKQAKRGGASSVHGLRGGGEASRAVEEKVERNIKEAVNFAVHFFEAHHVRRVLIGGTEENTNLFRSHLPKAWQSLVVGTFAMSMIASHSEVQTKAIQIGMEAEARREAALIERLITSAAKGLDGAVGLEDTLTAVNAGRVQTLVIAEGFRKVGYRHKESGQLLLTNGDATEKVFDVIDLAVSAVLRHGGEVEVVHQSEALEKSGNIGAVLRY